MTVRKYFKCIRNLKPWDIHINLIWQVDKHLYSCFKNKKIEMFCPRTHSHYLTEIHQECMAPEFVPCFFPQLAVQLTNPE